MFKQIQPYDVLYKWIASDRRVYNNFNQIHFNIA